MAYRYGRRRSYGYRPAYRSGPRGSTYGRRAPSYGRRSGATEAAFQRGLRAGSRRAAPRRRSYRRY